MRNLLGLLFILSIFVSCSKDEELEKSINFPDYFELVKMTGSFNSSETTGWQMEWQENYILYSNDNTFIKTRLFNDSIFRATGTYIYKTIENQKYIEFTFIESTSIIGNCTGDLMEVLMVLEEGNKLVSTWSYCDGPGLEYRKIMEICGTE